MANYDEWEDILRSTEEKTPVKAKKVKNVKEAKYSGHSYEVLYKKIKNNMNDRKLDKAYKKYNKYYGKMARAVTETAKLQKDQQEGMDVSSIDITVSADLANKYGKKLAKWGTKLLKEDIKDAASSYQIAIPRKVKSPKKLILKIKQWRLKRGVAKDIKKDTKAYIEESLDSAIFKSKYDGTVRKDIDAQVIRDLGLSKEKNEDNELDRLATLREFIVKNDKNGDPQHLTEVKHSVPPTPPTSDINQEKEQPLNEDNKPNVTSDDIMSRINENPRKKQDPTDSSKVTNQSIVDATSQEVESINKLLDASNRLKEMSITADPGLKKQIDTYLANINKSIEEIINTSNIRKEEKEVDKNNAQPLTPVPVEVDSTKFDDTKGIKPNVENSEFKIWADGNITKEPVANISKEEVQVNQTEPLRAEQISTPSALRATPKDIENLMERNKSAQLRYDMFSKQKADLEAEKNQLEQYVNNSYMQLFNDTRVKEEQAMKAEQSYVSLRGEVDELVSRRDAIDSALGRTR